MSPDSVSARSDGPRFTRPAAPPDPEAERVRQKQVRRAIFAGTVGTAIEWYDFFLYGTAAALVFPKLFFPDASALRRRARRRSRSTPSASPRGPSARRSSATGATASGARRR